MGGRPWLVSAETPGREPGGGMPRRMDKRRRAGAGVALKPPQTDAGATNLGEQRRKVGLEQGSEVAPAAQTGD